MNAINRPFASSDKVQTFLATAPHRIGIVVFPEASSFDTCGVAEVFSTANHELSRTFGIDTPAYSVEIISSQPGPVRMEMGIRILPDRTIQSSSNDNGALAAAVEGIDTLIVVGACWEPLEQAMQDRTLIAWLRRAATRAPRVASMCTGAFLLAEAGALEGVATTHWALCDRLRERYPQLDVRSDNIFVKSGKTYSSAGSTAALDLAIALVEEDLGRRVAMAVARRLVMFLKRAGGQSQFSTALVAQTASPDAMNGVPEWIVHNLGEDLSVAKLAARAAMSPRNFARVFVAQTGFTPARYVEHARVEKARAMIEETRLPLVTIAAKAGFENDRQMRRAFLRLLKVTPSEYAERFRGAAADNGFVAVSEAQAVPSRVLAWSA
jgi:transcriptional regulator GlxA family with amidase domain